MALVTIEIPENQVARVVKTLCKRGGRPENAAEAQAQLRAEVERWVIEEGHSNAVIEPVGLK